MEDIGKIETIRGKTFKYVDDIIIDHDRKIVKIYTNKTHIYVPDSLSGLNIRLYSEITNLNPKSFRKGSKEYIKGPLRVGVGTTLLLNDKFVILQVRDESVKFFKNKFNDFAGHLDADMVPSETIYDEFYGEVIVIKELENGAHAITNIATENVAPLSTFYASVRSFMELYGIKKSEIAFESSTFSELLSKLKPYRIIFFENYKKVDEFTGFYTIDWETSAIELIEIINANIDPNKVTFFSMEPIGTPVTLIPLWNFVMSKDTYYTPRVRKVRELLEKIVLEKIGEYSELE